MVTRESNSVLRRLVQQWDQIRAELERLNNVAEVRPSEGYQVFEIADPDNANILAFQCRPIVFNIPERADHHDVDLFVVVTGRFSFDRVHYKQTGALRMRGFSTEVGYFRRGGAVLSHIYGAHYDFAEDEIGHPVFHAQMKSFHSFAACVRDNYVIAATSDEDQVTGILKTVRLPTAQMDVFSTILQICADHLLYHGSGPEEREAFNSLLSQNTFCQGLAYRVPNLLTVEARECFRALHWYPRIT